MQPKTNIKKPDRIILFEVGLIVALLFVNWALNLQYKTDIACHFPTEDDILYDSAYIYTPFIEPIEKPDPPKQKIEEASVFDIRAIIKQVDNLFDVKDQKIVEPSFAPPGLIAPIVVKERIDSSTIVHDFVDKMPTFPGGENELRKFIVQNFDIPDIVYDYGNEFKINVEFVIDKNGEVSDFKILNCSRPGFGLETEAKRIYTKMPKWEPGVNSGKKVKVRLRQPIKIQIY